MINVCCTSFVFSLSFPAGRAWKDLKKVDVICVRLHIFRWIFPFRLFVYSFIIIVYICTFAYLNKLF